MPCVRKILTTIVGLHKLRYRPHSVYDFGAKTVCNPHIAGRIYLYVIKVIDKSMEPLIKDGAYVGIDMKDKELVSGYIYCVYLQYEGAVIKYIIKNREGIILKSENSMFDDILIKKEEIKDSDHFVIGKVVWVWQNI